MIVGSQAEAMQLENVTANPSTQAEGLIYQNTTTKKPVIDDGTDVSALLMEKHLNSVLTSQNLKGVVTAVDTYANLAARPRVSGATYFASDLQSYFIDNGTELVEAGGGVGSPYTYHVENFEVTTAANVSVTGTATVDNETAQPLFGTRSLKVTHVAGGQGSRILIDKVIPLQKGQQGVLNGVDFALYSPTADADAVYRFRILESSDDVAYTEIEEYKDIQAKSYVNPHQLLFTPATDSTSIKIIIDIITETTQASEDLVVDNFEFSSNPLRSIVFDNDTEIKSFTPTWTGVVNVGDTVNNGKFQYQGNRLIGTASLVLGATASINAPLALTLPDSAEIDTNGLAFGSGAEQPLGTVIFDNIDDVPYVGKATRASATEIELKHIINNDGVNRSVYLGRTSSTAPFSWDTNDTITVFFDVPVAGRKAKSSGVVTEGVEVDQLQELSWTPELKATTTDPTLGTGAIQVATAQRFGSWLIGNVKIRFGTSGTNAGSGNYYIELPNQLEADVTGQSGLFAIGSGYVRNDGASSNNKDILAEVTVATPTRIQFRNYNSTSQTVTSGAPFAWAANDYLEFNFQVKIDGWSAGLSATVISPFKTEITTGQEYKTGEVIDGKDVYAKEMVATGSFTSSASIGNVNTSYKITRMSGAINSNFFGVTGLNYTDPSGNTHRVEQNTVNGNIVCVISGPTVTSINAKVEYTK